MARYIDADKLKAYLLLDQSGMKDTVRRNNSLHPDRKLEFMAYIGAIEYCVTRINEEPTADVVEVKHGEWVPDSLYRHDYTCSICGKDAFEGTLGSYDVLTDYCLYCGAKMDGERRTDDDL